MTTFRIETPSQQLNELIVRLCLELAITETQYDQAESAYSTLGDWIGKDDGPLATFNPRIFPQGSLPLGTTVKPRQSEEFDADLVCIFQRNYSTLSAQQLYDLVLNRVLEHETYRPMVEPCERCIRLNYANRFHLDIVPAVPAGVYGSSRLLIPNRTKTGWQTTDPEGYQQWFESRSTTAYSTRMEVRATVDPMPEHEEAEAKTTLQRLVQLLKRRRDVYFDGKDTAPKSILLTTLTAQGYAGDLVVTDALIAVLNNLMAGGINAKQIPEVPNPSNPGENLARQWKEEPESYLEFLRFCLDLKKQIEKLLSQTDIKKIADLLQELFDPADGMLVKRAVASYAKDFQQTRESGGLRMLKGGAITTAATATTAKAAPIPRNNFYGS